MVKNEKPKIRQEQAAETRRKLLDSAARLFAENGFAATPVRSINQSIGMADGLMYHYFPGGKKEILKVIVQERIQRVVRIRKEKEEALSRMSLEDAMEEFFQGWSEMLAEHQDILKILIREADTLQLMSRVSFLEIIKKDEQWFPGFLKNRADAGEIRQMDFVSAADMLVGLLAGHFLTKIAGAEQGLLDDPERRRNLINYQIDLWKIPHAGTDSPAEHITAESGKIK